MSYRLFAGLSSAILIAAVLWPITWDRHRDSFPLSSYPMFAAPRTDAMITISRVVAIDAGGRSTPVAPRWVANDEVLQAKAVIAGAVRAGKQASAALCEKVAARLAAGQTRDRLLEVRIVTATHDAIAYLTGVEAVSSRQQVHARCPVPEPP